MSEKRDRRTKNSSLRILLIRSEAMGDVITAAGLPVAMVG